VRMADNLTTFICWLSWNLGPSGPVQTCYRNCFTLYKMYWLLK